MNPDPAPPPPQQPAGESKRKRRKDSYYPAPKARHKPWLRPRGPGGWQKVHKQPEEDKQQQDQPHPLCTYDQSASLSPHPLPKRPTPPPVLRSVCAYCVGAPCGLSRCTCVSLFLSIPSPLCAYCLGAPTGSRCTCSDTLKDTLTDLFDVVLLDL
jgi:hypothetical protein